MIGVGFIGAGNHARHHMKEFSRLSEARLVAVYDVDRERSLVAAHDFPPLIATNSVEELLSTAGIDAVIIATPAESHTALTLSALAAGCHVLLEKPMADTPANAWAIVEAARRAPDRVVLVGHCERFNRAYIDARKAVDTGIIGVPRFASASRLSPLHLNDPTWALGTLDTAVHDIDILLWLLGSEPVTVAAQGTIVNPALAIADHVMYQIGFATGALAQGHIGWVPFNGGYPLRDNAHPRLFLAGTTGTISVDLWQRAVAVHSHTDGSYFWPDDVLVGYGAYPTEVTAQNAAFLRAISDGMPPPISPREAAIALQVAHAAHQSLTIHNGAAVSLEGR